MLKRVEFTRKATPKTGSIEPRALFIYRSPEGPTDPPNNNAHSNAIDTKLFCQISHNPSDQTTTESFFTSFSLSHPRLVPQHINRQQNKTSVNFVSFSCPTIYLVMQLYILTKSTVFNNSVHKYTVLCGLRQFKLLSNEKMMILATTSCVGYFFCSFVCLFMFTASTQIILQSVGEHERTTTVKVIARYVCAASMFFYSILMPFEEIS